MPAPTWQPLGQPSIDGTPYPSVKTVAFSPAYAEDGTLFAIASNDGPAIPSADITRHLFRSTDRGQTWEAVRNSLPRDVFVALSPAFSQDQTILLGALLRADTTEPQGRCTIARSTDGGTTWSEPSVLATFDPKQYRISTDGICDPLVVQQGPDGIVALSATNVSTDLGQTWQPLSTPTSVKLVKGTFSPGFAQDGTIFFATEGAGIWAYGSRTKSAAGDLGCKVPLATEIGNIYDKKPWVWAVMGCPADRPRASSSPSDGGCRPPPRSGPVPPTSSA